LIQNLNLHRRKVESGERLTFDEGVELFKTDDLNALGKLADFVRRKKHGRTTYLTSTGISITRTSASPIVNSAGFTNAPDRKAHTRIRLTKELRLPEMPLRRRDELHIVGGLNTKLPFEYYTDLFRALKASFRVCILKALTMVELDFFARFYKMSDEEVIERLKAREWIRVRAAARRFSPSRRARASATTNATARAGWNLSGKVHKAGLKTNATMLYGHIETIEDRVDHFVKLREQQDKTGGFQCFIPLAFYPNGTALSSLPGPDAIDNLKTIAVSRLMIDNFDHIKAYWVMLGKATTQTALHFGANDVDGTITDGGELTHAYSVEEGGESKMTKQELIAMIENAGFEAVERDTVYNRVERVAA
jgi:aminodeoxyfutalosine synthase